jgi:micrococcal nuclease
MSVFQFFSRRPLFNALMLCALFMTSNAQGAERGFTNYDGDTLRATFSIANIDTPEIKGACDSGRKLALRAKKFTSEWLDKGAVTIKQTGVDKYGRVLALVTRGTDDLGLALIEAGLARPWAGRREKWC